MNKGLTRDHLSAWLAAVHADTELDGHAFKVAFALSQGADAGGFIWSAVAANLGSNITEVLGNLAARGHIKARGNQRKIEGFQILVPAEKSPRRRSRVAAIVPFPAARRVAFIHKHAERMAALSQTQGDAHLRQQLRILADTMRRRGIPEETIGREIKSMESAVRTELWKCIITPEKGEELSDTADELSDTAADG